MCCLIDTSLSLPPVSNTLVYECSVVDGGVVGANLQLCFCQSAQGQLCKCSLLRPEGECESECVEVWNLENCVYGLTLKLSNNTFCSVV